MPQAWVTLDTIAKKTRLRREAMMTDRLALADTPKDIPSPDVMAKVIISGDLSQLDAKQKVSYYGAVCESVGLNPLTKPFEFINLSGKLVLYATRNCTDQLRKLYGISVEIVGREVVEDCYVVTARASMPGGRHDESTGVVAIAGTKGEFRANLMLKCETKSKRRVTLSLVGLSTLDESEVEVDSIPGAQPVPFDPAPLTHSLTPSPGPAAPNAVIADPGAEGAPVAPANLNTQIPEAWQPFVEKGTPLTGSILDVKTETAAGRKSAKSYTKTTITLWPTDKLITDIVELYTLDLAMGAAAVGFKDRGERVTVTVKETPRGHELLTLQIATDEAF
jgi:hypothetical protein